MCVTRRGGSDLDIDRKGRGDGRTVLSHSAEDGQESLVARLLDRGAELDARDMRGRTALSWAAQRGRAGVVGMLLERGAGTEEADERYCVFVESPGGRTPLFYAAEEGCEDVVLLLLRKGADAGRCDGGGGGVRWAGRCLRGMLGWLGFCWRMVVRIRRSGGCVGVRCLGM